MLAFSGAVASSHTLVERDQTKLMLTEIVDEVCARGVPDCDMLKETANNLYSDPEVVTDDDVVRIGTLQTLLKKYESSPELLTRLGSAKADLARAVERADMLTAHVFYIHGGAWEEFESCRMPT
jgi:hypothetical protein